jgi:hypothetical protein
MSFLVAYPGTDEAIFEGWCEHMKYVIGVSQAAMFEPPSILN